MRERIQALALNPYVVGVVIFAYLGIIGPWLSSIPSTLHMAIGGIGLLLLWVYVHLAAKRYFKEKFRKKEKQKGQQ